MGAGGGGLGGPDARVPSAGTEEPGRLDDYDTVATSLALLGDTELRELVDRAVPLGAGIGGTSARLDVSGTPVFVKRVLIGHPSAAESFGRLGWGSAGMYTTGALELAGAIALLIPVLQSVAAMALSALMLGAFVVQTAVFDGQYAATSLILIVPLVLIAWARRRHNAELMRLLRRQPGRGVQRLLVDPDRV